MQEALKGDFASIVACFGPEVLRPPTEEEKIFFLRRAAAMAFQGMLGSIGCCNCTWKNCPKVYHEQQKGKVGAQNLTVEAVSDYRLHISNIFFGNIDRKYDINDEFPIQGTILEVFFHLQVEHEVARVKHNKKYFLYDGINPK